MSDQKPSVNVTDSALPQKIVIRRKELNRDISIVQYCEMKKADDYVDGPLENKSVGMNGDVWVFGKVTRKSEVYIKVCINQLANNRGKRSICISFHIAEHPLVYMFKREGK